jgi:hypothetical protein
MAGKIMKNEGERRDEDQEMRWPTAAAVQD